MRRLLTLAVGFAAFSISAVSFAASPQIKQINSRGKALKPAPTVIVPNHKAAYLIDQNKMRGRK